MNNLLRSRFGLSSIVIAAAVGLLLVLANAATSASAAGLNQGSVVPEAVRRDLPSVLDGRVFAHAQVGDRIFVGGDFQQVRLTNGTVIDQPYIYAYDIDTGQVDPNFRPVLSNLVRSLEPTQAGDGLYAGGLFTQWDGAFEGRFVKLDAQGNLITSFDTFVSARVQDIAEIGNDVYIGGDFLDVSGVAVQGLAKLDRHTGAVDPSFTPQFIGSNAGSSLIRGIEATPDGSSLFVLHYASLVDLEIRDAVAKFDINGGNPTLSSWNIPWAAQQGRRNCVSSLRDLAISPDGSFLVIGGQGADNPPNCDSILRYPTAGNGTVNFDWTARMYSSVFSLAVSDVAVYAGGHFCAAPRNPIAPGQISSDFTGTANGCRVNNPNDSINPSVIDPANAVFRNQMAALDPTTGQALPWNPGSNNDLAVFDLTLIDRGLLAGHDGDRFNEFLVGRSGFFDLATPGADTTAPTFNVTSPTNGSVPDAVTTLTGNAVDDRNVESVTVQLQNTTTRQWLQANGTFGNSRANLHVSTTVTGLGQMDWSVTVPNLPAGAYEVNGFAADAFGNTGTTATSTFTIAGTTACTVSLNDNDQPVIALSSFVAERNNSLVIRRNGSFLSTETPDITSFVDDTATPGDYSYTVRWRPNGVQTDVACSPSTITVPNQQVGPRVCEASVNGGNVALSWTAIAGEDAYQVIDNDGWVATVNNATTFTDTDPGNGDRTYTIRNRMNGQTTNLTCSPTVNVDDAPPPPDGCRASVNGGNVVLSWTAIAGEDAYQVIDNDGWVATVNNATTFTDTNPGNGDRTYTIRNRMNGQTTNVTCSPAVDAG